jgi:ribosomal protein S18 acetylase RimI-like enzyme
MPELDPLALRRAGAADAKLIAALHADSWRRHYRGAYSDAFLDDDVEADRHAVWAGRLQEQDAGTVTILAEDEGALVGFVHVVFEDDPTWGALIDNLHVTHARKRMGIGRRLMAGAGEAMLERGPGGLYLWVLEQNTIAQAFYEALGGQRVERAIVEAPGGDTTRLNGAPAKLRYVWPEPAGLQRPR